jgi:hypothetical protein
LKLQQRLAAEKGILVFTTLWFPIDCWQWLDLAGLWERIYMDIPVHEHLDLCGLTIDLLALQVTALLVPRQYELNPAGGWGVRAFGLAHHHQLPPDLPRRWLLDIDRIKQRKSSISLQAP